MSRRSHSSRGSARALAVLLALYALAWGGAAGAQTARVSVDNLGVQGDDTSQTPELNTDGRFVAYISEAENLVPGDTNDARDVFVHDRQTGTVERVSVSSLGVEGNDGSGIASSSSCMRAEISGDGRWVVFESEADNLVPGDTNEVSDIFVHDRLTGQTERVSLNAGGGEITGFSTSPAISRDGRFVAFVSGSAVVPEDTNFRFDVFVRDRVAGTTERVSVGSGGTEADESSGCPSLSADGRYVAFYSEATNLVPGDTNDVLDVFVRDRLGDSTQRVSVSSAGDQADDSSSAPRISGNGSRVAFASSASNLVSADGNSRPDIFVHDLVSEVTTRVNTAVNGAEASIGAVSSQPDLDDEGRFATFASGSSDLVPDDTNGVADVFVKDLLTGMIRRASLAHDGSQMQGPFSASSSVLSGNGRLVGFASDADNLVPGDTNDVQDVFVRDLPVFPFEYAAKVVCGLQRDPTDLSLAPGLYATTVNIHSSTGGVELFKKLALTSPPREQQPGEIYPIAQHVLQYDQALGVTCDNLRREAFGGEFPTSYIEGFLVVQSTASLDVTAVYSTAALTAGGEVGDHSSIDIQPVAERRQSPRLSITKSGRYFCNALPIERECTLVAALYTVVIRNDGPVPAEGVVLTDEVSRLDGIPVVQVLAAPHEVPPTAVFSVTGPASIQVEIPELAPGEQAQVRFWALAVVSPSMEPDVLINRAQVTAENASEPASVAIQQAFD